ncbi:MAG: hypothetical protein ACRDVD_08785, partial [Acidimicrobiia bacterium]
MRRWTRLWALLMALALVAAACGDGEGTATTTDGGDGTTPATGDGGEGGDVGADFQLFGAPTGVEGEALQGFIDVYNAETGSSITYQGSDNFESQLRIAVEG